MPQVNVIELVTDAQVQENGMLSGSHIWVELVFDGGRTITIRADERDMYFPGRSSLYVAADHNEDEINLAQTVRL